jgi:hypothetical protein
VSADDSVTATVVMASSRAGTRTFIDSPIEWPTVPRIGY